MQQYYLVARRTARSKVVLNNYGPTDINAANSRLKKWSEQGIHVDVYELVRVIPVEEKRTVVELTIPTSEKN